MVLDVIIKLDSFFEVLIERPIVFAQISVAIKQRLSVSVVRNNGLTSRFDRFHIVPPDCSEFAIDLGAKVVVQLRLYDLIIYPDFRQSQDCVPQSTKLVIIVPFSTLFARFMADLVPLVKPPSTPKKAKKTPPARVCSIDIFLLLEVVRHIAVPLPFFVQKTCGIAPTPLQNIFTVYFLLPSAFSTWRTTTFSIKYLTRSSVSSFI